MKHEIDVPKGCKVVSVETTDEAVVVKFEKDEPNIREYEPEFKENDIVYTEFHDVKMISIFECEHKESGGIKFKYTFSINSNHLSNDSIYAYDIMRYATDSEKKLLFDKLKEKCLMFDGKDVVRWRANPDGKYFYLPGDGDVAETEDDMSNWDDGAYYIGNYFPTRELAEAFQKQYLELLNNFHKNL